MTLKIDSCTMSLIVIHTPICSRALCFYLISVMNTNEDHGYTSDEFYTKYLKNLKTVTATTTNYSQRTDVTQPINSYQQNADGCGHLSQQTKFGHFTTALNAPRIVPLEGSEQYYQQYGIKTTNIAVERNAGHIDTRNSQYENSQRELRRASSQGREGNVSVEGAMWTETQRRNQTNIPTMSRPPLPQVVRTNSQQDSRTSQNGRVVGSVLKSSQVREGEVIKGHSRIEYVPFEQKVIDYETREWVETIPVEKKVVEYEERRTIEQVPREVKKIDYYAVEYIKEYVPQVMQEKVVEYVPVEKVVNRTQFIPIQTQIIHRPDGTRVQGQSRVLYGPPGQTQSRVSAQPPPESVVSAIPLKTSTVHMNLPPLPGRNQSRAVTQVFEPTCIEQPVVYMQEPIPLQGSQVTYVSHQPIQLYPPQIMHQSQVISIAPQYILQQPVYQQQVVIHPQQYLIPGQNIVYGHPLTYESVDSRVMHPNALRQYVSNQQVEQQIVYEPQSYRQSENRMHSANTGMEYGIRPQPQHTTNRNTSKYAAAAEQYVAQLQRQYSSKK